MEKEKLIKSKGAISRGKRYEKTFVHIINNTLMRTILEQLLFDKLRICCGNYKGSTRPYNIEGV